MVISAEKFRDEVETFLIKFGLASCRWEFIGGVKSPEFIGEFERHLPRFLKGAEFIEKNVRLDSDSTVLDCGSPAPFQSLYFHSKYNCTVICCDIFDTEWKASDKLYYHKCNICRDELPMEKYDLVILTEVLEHLPCNLYRVRDKIIDAAKGDGFILFSVPLRGHIEKPYDYDYPKEVWNKYHGHLREFTVSNAEEFLNVPRLRMVEKEKVFTSAYMGEMYVVLAKKVKDS